MLKMLIQEFSSVTSVKLLWETHKQHYQWGVAEHPWHSSHIVWKWYDDRVHPQATTQCHCHSPKNNILKLPNEPLGSTEIAEWEQKLFLSSPTRPLSTQTHTKRWHGFSRRGADLTLVARLVTDLPFPTREAGEPPDSTGTTEEGNISQHGGGVPL